MTAPSQARVLLDDLRRVPNAKGTGFENRTLEPIREVVIQEQRIGLVKRRSMMRIMARRTKATTVLA
jgi:hypothetical protein